MTPEKKDKNLIRWLLTATIALLALVLCLQLWQIFGQKPSGDNGSLDSAAAPAAPSEPLAPSAASVSHGKAAMVEDVQALNPALSFDDLAALSVGELEQLYVTGAPGLPVGLSSAAQAAETYAGTLAADSVTSETDPELDESPAHYEVELHHPTLGDFEYKVDAYTGEVLEGAPNILQSSYVPASGGEEVAAVQPAASETEVPASKAEVPAPEAAAPDSGAPSSTAAQQPAGAEERAKNAAFTHAGVSAAGTTVTKCKLDWEDGRQVYEIEFWADGTEYDYEVEAATGVILKAEQKRDGRTAAGGPASFIGEEAAKSAAFAHAGVSAADAARVKCELDKDDGRWLYEIEFRQGGMEYDYEIDAATAEVLKAEQES